MQVSLKTSVSGSVVMLLGPMFLTTTWKRTVSLIAALPSTGCSKLLVRLTSGGALGVGVAVGVRVGVDVLVGVGVGR